MQRNAWTVEKSRHNKTQLDRDRHESQNNYKWKCPYDVSKGKLDLLMMIAANLSSPQNMSSAYLDIVKMEHFDTALSCV